MIQRFSIPLEVRKAAIFAIHVWCVSGTDGYGCIGHRFGTFAQTQQEWDDLKVYPTYFDLSDPQLLIKLLHHINSLYNRADLYYTPNIFSKPRRLNVFALPSKLLYSDSDKHTLAEYEAINLLPNIHVQTSENSFMDAFMLKEAVPANIQQKLNTAIVNALKAYSGDEKLNYCCDPTHYFRLICTTNLKPKYRDENGNSPPVSDYEKPRKMPYTLDEIMGILEPYMPPENAGNGFQCFHRGSGFSGFTDPAYLEAVKLYETEGGIYGSWLKSDHYIQKGEIDDRSLVFSQLVNDTIFRLWPVLELQEEGLTLTTVQAIAEVCPLNKRIADHFGDPMEYAAKEVQKQYGYLKDAKKLLSREMLSQVENLRVSI